jgi:hypothetical protein
MKFTEKLTFIIVFTGFFGGLAYFRDYFKERSKKNWAERK